AVLRVARGGPAAGRAPPPRPAARPAPGGGARIGRAPPLLERRAEHASRQDAGPVLRPDAEPVGALPVSLVPHLGSIGVLPVERRLRLPRSAAGRARAAPGRAATRARTHRPRRLATVR